MVQNLIKTYLKSSKNGIIIILIFLTFIFVYSKDFYNDKWEPNKEDTKDSNYLENNSSLNTINDLAFSVSAIFSNEDGIGLFVESGNLNIRKTFYKMAIKGDKNNIQTNYYSDPNNLNNPYALIGPYVKFNNILNDNIDINLALLFGQNENNNIKDITLTKINFKYKIIGRLHIGIDGYFLYINSKQDIIFLNNEKFFDNRLKYQTILKIIYNF